MQIGLELDLTGLWNWIGAGVELMEVDFHLMTFGFG